MLVYIYIYPKTHAHTSSLSYAREKEREEEEEEERNGALSHQRKWEREKRPSRQRREIISTFFPRRNFFRAIFSLLAHSLYSLFWLSSSMALLFLRLSFSLLLLLLRNFFSLLLYYASRYRHPCITCTHVRDYRRRTASKKHLRYAQRAASTLYGSVERIHSFHSF